MKNSNKCSKCDSIRVAKIQHHTNAIKVGTFGMAKRDLYICADCGYNEIYIHPDHLGKFDKHVKSKG